MLRALVTVSTLGGAPVRTKSPVNGERIKAELHEPAAKVPSPVWAAKQHPPCPCSNEELSFTNACSCASLARYSVHA